jgi:glucosylceramidase
MSGRMQGMRYETIPEADEEVEPEPKCTTGFNSFSILVLGFLVMAIGGAIYISFHASPINKDIITLSPVAVIQTSKSHGDNLHAFTADKMIQRGMKVPNAMLGFGNVDCKADAESCANVAKIRVNKEKQFQMILGFGGAFTESSAYVYYKLPRAVQKNFIDLYFGDSGIGYSMGRVHINSCDFGLGTYSYDDVENDYKLEFFEYEVLHDRKWLIPFIKTALEASKRPIKILASPWSPPWWMKQPNKERHNEQNMTGSNDPQGLRDEPLVKNAWADYIVKWIFAFGWRGIPVWGITVQNEPKFAAPWEALKMTDDFQRDFVNDYLGPQMDKSHPDVKLLIFDHNKNNMTAWIDTVMAKLKNNLYVDGVAFHWYAGSNDREMDGTYGYDQVNMTHTAYPDKILLASEGCSCPGVLLNDWFRAERFAHDVVFDLQVHACTRRINVPKT